MPNYSVVVSGLGTVHQGKSRIKAEESFDECVKESILGEGKYGHKDVVMFDEDSVARQHIAVKKNPTKSRLTKNPTFTKEREQKKAGSLLSIHESFIGKTPKIEVCTNGKYIIDGKTVGRGQKVKSGVWDISVSKNPTEPLGKTGFEKPSESQLRNGIELICTLDGVTAAKVFATENGYNIESKVYKIKGIKHLSEAKKEFNLNWHKFIGAGSYGASESDLKNRLAKRNPSSMDSFIKENRKEIDGAIKRVCPAVKLNDKERELWIRNDQGLAKWARSRGVRI